MAHRVVDASEVEARHGIFRPLSEPLGLSAFRVNRLELSAGASGPEHDHAGDGQEEVYVVTRGSADFEIDGQRVPIESGQMLRIEAACRRRLLPGPSGVTILAIGCAPGAYERPAHFRVRAGS